jgi:acyl-CoA thioesterase-1
MFTIARRLHLHVGLFALALVVGTNAFAADGKPELTPEQTQKLETAKATAAKDPAVKAATEKAAAARKAYQAVKSSTNAEESRTARVAFVEATRDVELATRAAMIAADASIEPLLEPLPKRVMAATRPARDAAPATTAGADSGAVDDDAKRLEAAKAEALKDPSLRAARDKFNAARKIYQADRAKFPADRDKNVAIAFRAATKEFDDVVNKFVIAKDPSLAPLINDPARGKRKMNEGETVADSDSLKNPAVRPIKDEPGLPRVLLIGDSISIGYTLQVRELLKGKANVHRIPVNGGATEVGLANMKEWLGDGKWDVIHFNFGLHDAKHKSATEFRASREEYSANLQKLVTQMKATGAKLIFATTTPVPKDGKLSPTRVFDSIPARNEVATKLMKENGVAIDDLYTVVLPVRDQAGRDNDVHFQPAGYEVIAKAVAASIETQLPKTSAQTSSR